MVPSAFVILHSLPLTPNGKVDRAALRRACQPLIEPEPEMIPARTPAEELVVEIWKKVLGLKECGITSNFFNLGGHSLAATKVILKLREIFRTEISLRSLFEMPTVEGQVIEMSRIRGGREIVEEIAWTYIQVEQLSDDYVQRILAQYSNGRNIGGSSICA
jgi:acyl carrier protein